MENTTLLVLAVFILLLGLCLLAFFIYLVKSTRTDSRQAISRLQAAVTKLRSQDMANDRTFKEFEMLLNRRLRTVFSKKSTSSVDFGVQLDLETDVEKGTEDAAVQTDMTRVNSLPPLLVRPVPSSDVVIPITG